MSADPTDRVAGGLCGVAYGDAMGMPGELWPRHRVVEHFGWIDRFLPGPDGHFVVDGFRAGQVTDDTQQTLVLAKVIIEGGGRIDAQLLAGRLVEWADRVQASEGYFLGPSSARALALLREGRSIDEAGARGETNGGAMRIVPVGLAVPIDDLDRLVASVVEACRPTHFTDVAISGACLIAGAVSAAVDADRFEDVIEPALRAAEMGRQCGRSVVAPSIVRRAELAAALAGKAGNDTQLLDDMYELVGAGVATTESVPAAFGLAVAARGDPVHCARLAANLGGDSDTIGAMSTAICGAFSGLSAFPPNAVTMLDEVNGFDLRALAGQLARCRSRGAR